MYSILLRRFFMRSFPKLQLGISLLVLSSNALFAAAQAVEPRADHAPPEIPEWTSTHVQHVYGLPDAKPKESGTLTIHGGDLVFAGKAGRSTIRLPSVYAVGTGKERVELWGMKGRLLRMAIPDGGGLLAATFMHHRVDMFTVEFADPNGAYHAAVFFLPANEAERVLQSITAAPIAHREPADMACNAGSVKLSTVRVPLPTWNADEVPAAYRALLYEHLIERLRQSPVIDRVYRDGEPGCSQYTVQLTATGYKAGNQIARASTGPVGMFVGITQMGFDMRILDAPDREIGHDQIQATVRGESESINVSQTVARKVAKEFIASRNESQRK
jgi:hypothetical protein